MANIINDNIITDQQIIIETEEHKFARDLVNATLERIKKEIDNIK